MRTEAAEGQPISLSTICSPSTCSVYSELEEEREQNQRLQDVLHNLNKFTVAVVLGCVRDWKDKVEMANRLRDLESGASLFETRVKDINDRMDLTDRRLSLLVDLVDYTKISIPDFFAPLAHRCTELRMPYLGLEAQKERLNLLVVFDDPDSQSSPFFEEYTNLVLDHAEYAFDVTILSGKAPEGPTNLLGVDRDSQPNAQ